MKITKSCAISEIQTDHVVEAQRPDLVVVDKKEGSCKIIDFAVPGDSGVPGVTLSRKKKIR